MGSKNNEAMMTEEEFLALHKKYKESNDKAIRNRIVTEYMYIPRAAAMQLRGIAAGYAQIEDMVNQGAIALIDSVDKYDATKGIRFETYAFMRVKGSVIDLVRKQAWIPRRVRGMAKEIMNAYSELCSELMREPAPHEIAKKLNITEEKLAQCSGESANMVMLSFEELIQNTNQMGNVLEASLYDDVYPEKMLLKGELREILKDAIEELTERERLIITLYYYENLIFSEIAKVLDISIQRVSQLHAKALLKLKSHVEVYMNELV